MLFNSIAFLIFLPVIFVLYWCVFNKNYKFQNMLLLAASFFSMAAGTGVFCFF